MSNKYKSLINGVVGILLILTAVRDILSTLDSVLLAAGVILSALGATIAGRARGSMQELHSSEEGEDGPA
jgi:hypothetical protein